MSELKLWVRDIIIALLIVGTILFLIVPAKVNGSSMYPTFEDGEYVLINKVLHGDIKYGDVVVLETDIPELREHKILIKRIVGKGGDHMVVQDGMVYRNDELLSEDYINGIETSGNVDVVVPENEYFIMGDNRPNSNDSRVSFVGTLSGDDIMGVVNLRIFPLNKIKIF